MVDQWLKSTNDIQDSCSGVYKIFNKINGKVYIGMSTDLRLRLKTHYHKLRSNRHANKHLQNSVNKFGIENFSFTLIEMFQDPCDKELLVAESKYQSLFKSLDKNYGYNIRPTDLNGKVRHTREHREHMSQIMTGRELPEETRLKLRALNLGKQGSAHTQEHKEHMSKLMTGRKVSKEMRKKLSDAKLGKPNLTLKGKSGRKQTKAEKQARSIRVSGGNNPNAVKIVDENGNIYTSIKNACTALSCSRSYVEKLIKNNKLRRI